MSSKFLISLNESRQRVLTQYVRQGNTFSPSKDIQLPKKLDAGVYKASLDFSGNAMFEIYDVQSDELLKIQNKRIKKLQEKFDRFWERKEHFTKMGYIHKDGAILEGPPGSGKSCGVKTFMQTIAAAGDVVFVVESAGGLDRVLAQFREIESDRRVMVVMEDFERQANWYEHQLLELLDGPNAVGGVYYLCTTNFINQIPARLRRKGRFSETVHWANPDYEERLAYLDHKLRKAVHEDQNLARYLAERTDGRGFGDIKDLIVSIVCLGYDPQEAVRDLTGGKLPGEGKTLGESALDDMLNREPKPVAKKINEDMASELWSLGQGILVDGALASTLDQTGAPSSDSIKDAIGNQLKRLQIAGVQVDAVTVDCDPKHCSITVDFSNDDGEVLTICFCYDDEDGATAVVYDQDAGQDDVITMFDLDSLSPGVLDSEYGKFVDLSSLDWLNKTTMIAMMDAGDFSSKPDPRTAMAQVVRQYDEFGNVMTMKTESMSTDEAYKAVVQGGRKIRLPVIRERKLRRLNDSQREALRRAGAKRKTEAAKRAKSLGIRKRLAAQ